MILLFTFVFLQIKALPNENNITTQNCSPDSNCFECLLNNNHFCTKCNEGYGLQRDTKGNITGKCEKCKIERCNDCQSDSNICKSFSKSIDILTEKIPNCLESDYYDINCLKCDVGTRLEYGRCINCPDNCDECDVNGCTKCSIGYILDEWSLTCVTYCPGNCFKCSEGLLCQKCRNGFGPFSTLPGRCSPCPENCQLCSSSYGICQKCYQGYGIEVIYGIHNYEKCVKCPENCDICNFADECIQCSIGYRVDGETSKCVKCPDGCASCEENGFCPECLPGYGPYLNAQYEKSGICKPCTDNCDSCSQDYSKCEKCSEYYGTSISNGFKTGKCSRCPFGCKLCTYDATFCDQCIENYTNLYDTGLCIKCPENAYSCYMNLDYQEPIIERCIEGYGVVQDSSNDPTKRKCAKCSEHCISCLYNADACDICESGYFKDEQGCSKCSDGCLSCKNQTDCTECADGYGLNSESGSCSKCNNWCSKCSRNYKFCEECMEEYGPLIGLDGSLGTCEKCPDGCKSCAKDSTRCLECKEGYGPEISISSGIPLGTCSKCPDNCKNCSSGSTKCDECYLGFGPYYDYSNTVTIHCASCPENCDYCPDDNATCSSCGEGKGFLYPNVCVNCPDHCISCQEESFCNECEEGYGLVFNEDNYSIQTCKKCPPNCADCINSSYCDQCLEGYELDIETHSCFKCGSNCLSCSNKMCDECEEGYGLVLSQGEQTGECKKCSSHCADCSKNYEKCELCEFGYGLNEVDETSILCSACPDGCSQCFVKDTCKYCKEGYAYVETNRADKTGKCEKCPDNCKVCSNGENCIVCEKGYYSPDGLCYSCPPNCESCNYTTGICEICDEGYSHRRLADGTSVANECVACPKNCKSCESDNSQCDVCMSGFGFKISNETNSTECFSCADPNCEDCTANKDECMRCYEDYFFDDVYYSPYFLKCVARNQTCEVENCARCLYQSSTECIYCKYELKLARNFQCREFIYNHISPPSLKPSYQKYGSVKSGEISIDVSEYDYSNKSQIVTFKLNDPDIESVAIENWVSTDIAFEIHDTMSTLSFRVGDHNHGNFDVIINTDKSIQYYFNKNSFPSFKNAKNKISLFCKDCSSSGLAINKVQPASKVTIDSLIPIFINDLEFYQSSSFDCADKQRDNHYKAKTVKINLNVQASIERITITEKLIMGFGSSVVIGDNVDISNTTIELPYDQSQVQLFTDQAFLNGNFMTLPLKIVIKDKKGSIPLAYETYLIAESPQEFDCQSMMNIIHIEANCSLKSFYCAEEYLYGNSFPVYRLYGTSKPLSVPKSKKISTKTIIIIGSAVGGVVVVVAIVLIVFFVVKYKRENRGQSENEIREDDDIETPNYI